MQFSKETEDRLSSLRIKRNALERDSVRTERVLADALDHYLELVNQHESTGALEEQFERVLRVLGERLNVRLQQLELQRQEIGIRRGEVTRELYDDDTQEFEYQAQKLIEDYWKDSARLSRLAELPQYRSSSSSARKP